VSSVAVAPSTRELVLGRYRPVRPLGSGGSGSVWLAFDERSGLDVALKIIPREGKAAARAEREALAARRLRHDRCVRSYDVGHDASHVYIAYEYVPGRTLRESLRSGALTDEEVVEVAAQVLDALAHAHRAGIVHRDVKPSNILLEDADAPAARLLDFGLAQFDGADTLTAVGDVPGTLAYIAPERLAGEDATAESDVWSVGVLLWEALAERHPFWGVPLQEVAVAIHAGAPPLGTERRDLPRRLLAAVDSALARDPARRPHASALAAELRNALKKAPRRETTAPRGRPETDAQTAPRMARRLIPVGLAMIAAGIGATLLPFWPPVLVAAIVAAAGLGAWLDPRIGLAAALAAPVFPLGNHAESAAVLYAMLAVGLLLLLHGIPSIGPPAAAAAESAAVEILTLDEALRAAVANNRDVAKATELRTFLEGKYVEERAAALPQFVATGEVLRSWDESQAVFGIPPASNRYSAQVGITQPLYSSGAVAAGIRAAGKGLATADDRFRTARNSVLLDVHAAFHDILLARELNRIALENRGQKARHLDEARKKLDAGTATDYDVLAAEVALRNAGPEVVRTENSVRFFRERLRFLLGRDGREVDVTGSLSSEVVAPPGYDDALGTAVEHRPDLSDLRHRLGVAREMVVIARSGNRPRLDFRGAVGRQEIDFGIADISGTSWSAGLFASWPLFDGRRTRGRVAQAESDVRTLRIEEARLLDAVALEVRDAVNAVREAGEIVNALAGTVEQADRLVTMAEKGYEYGVKTRLDVEDAQLNRNRALGNLAGARRDYLVAGAALRRAMGTLGDGIPVPGEGNGAFRPASSPLDLAVEVWKGEPSMRK